MGGQKQHASARRRQGHADSEKGSRRRHGDREATVVGVVDGDTLDLMVDLGFNVHNKIHVGLYGINAPESRTKDATEKELGLKAKKFTSDWLTNHKWVFVNTITDKNDKDGRTLARIFSSEKIDDPTTACLNVDIVRAGLAREYYGVGDETWAEFKHK
jgi:micrococcal nuclease